MHSVIHHVHFFLPNLLLSPTPEDCGFQHLIFTRIRTQIPGQHVKAEYFEIIYKRMFRSTVVVIYESIFYFKIY